MGRRLLTAALACLAFLGLEVRATGMLYPQASETRELVSLDGLWNFRAAPILDKKPQWHQQDLAKTGKVIQMPVPASYNDITVERGLRDHVGTVWYDRTFFVSESWQYMNKSVWLRFGSVSYLSEVWVNGKLAMKHEMGHLPFEADITSFLEFGKKNRVTVACDNSLGQTTVPQGYQTLVPDDNGRAVVQQYTFDFFNYAGIDRPVTLYTRPMVYVDDITVETGVDTNGTGYVHYIVEYGGGGDYNESEVFCAVSLLDHANNIVEVNNNSYGNTTGSLEVPNARLWWPYLMHPDPGYMYTLEVSLFLLETEELLDVYRLPIGIRTLKWSNDSFTINNKAIYFHGFGRHEDSDIRGKGLDLPLVTRDYNLIQWVGGNAYRTSHYPYADEIMDMADRNGIMIIDECPSVDTDVFTSALLIKHKQSLTELIKRDKNRPSVIAWSIANEPRTNKAEANAYFGSVAAHVKTLDKTRPVTMAIAVQVTDDKAGQHMDVLMFNRYNGWYSNAGKLDMITQRVVDEATAWHKKYNKTVIMSEYGADTYEGLHLYPAYVWSEEYQVQLMSQHFKAFDILRAKTFFIGEFIWNFADFKTAQTTTRAGGNKKGIFTRNRQPKASAFHLRKRYHKLSNELYNSKLPDDLSLYEVQPVSVPQGAKTEL